MMSVGRRALKGLRDDGLDHVALPDVVFDGGHLVPEGFRRKHRCDGQSSRDPPASASPTGMAMRRSMAFSRVTASS
jgi:hypothetical protein